MGIISEIKNADEEIRVYLAQQVLGEIYKNNFFKFCKYLGYKDITERTHGDMIRCLQSESKRKLIVMPRGTFKSSIGVVAYSIWNLIKNPNIRILIDSEVFANSKTFLREIKNHLESDAITSIFGDFKSPKNWTEGSITINQRTINLKESSVRCSGIGVSAVGQHFDLIIGDDYNSDKNSDTAQGRDKIIQHYKMNLSILEPDGTYVVIGTRYAINDIIGHILVAECDSMLDAATGRQKK